MRIIIIYILWKLGFKKYYLFELNPKVKLSKWLELDKKRRKNCIGSPFDFLEKNGIKTECGKRE